MPQTSGGGGGGGTGTGQVGANGSATAGGGGGNASASANFGGGGGGGGAGGGGGGGANSNAAGGSGGSAGMAGNSGGGGCTAAGGTVGSGGASTCLRGGGGGGGYYGGGAGGIRGGGGGGSSHVGPGLTAAGMAVGSGAAYVTFVTYSPLPAFSAGAAVLRRARRGRLPEPERHRDQRRLGRPRRLGGRPSAAPTPRSSTSTSESCHRRADPSGGHLRRCRDVRAHRSWCAHGHLTFTDNTAGTPDTVALTGTATDAGFAVSPGSPFDYGTRAVGSSTSQTFTVTNDGTSPLAVAAVAFDVRRARVQRDRRHLRRPRQ